LRIADCGFADRNPQCETLPNFPIMNYVVRTKGAAAAAAGIIQREWQTIDPKQVGFHIKPLTGFIPEKVDPLIALHCE
jgi:hypothetical protein